MSIINYKKFQHKYNNYNECERIDIIDGFLLTFLERIDAIHNNIIEDDYKSLEQNILGFKNILKLFYVDSINDTIEKIELNSKNKNENIAVFNNFSDKINELAEELKTIKNNL